MFELEERRVEGVPTLQVRGDVDSASASELRATLRALPDGEAVVVDLRHVPFMDSSGLGALVCGFRDLQSRWDHLPRGSSRDQFGACSR